MTARTDTISRTAFGMVNFIISTPETLHLTTPVWQVLDFRLDEGINRFYRLDTTLALMFDESGDNGPRDDQIAAALLNQAGCLRLASGNLSRDIPGIVASCECLGQIFNEGEKSGTGKLVRFFHLTLRPRIWFGARFRRTRTFVDVTPKKIVETLVSCDGKLPVTRIDSATGLADSWGYALDLDESDPHFAALNEKREFVFQYGETDADFLLRWLERQGWFFYFQTASEQKADKTAMPAETLIVTNRNPVIMFRKTAVTTIQATMSGQSEKVGRGLYSLRGAASMIPGQVRMRDYDPTRPELTLSACHPAAPAANSLPPVEMEDEYFVTQAEGDALAAKRYQALAAGRMIFRGETNLPGIRAGYTFEYNKMRYLVIEVLHEAARSPDRWSGLTPPPGTPTTGYRNVCLCVVNDAAVPYVPPRTAPWPKIKGALTGWVVADPTDAQKPWRESAKDTKSKIDRYRICLEADPEVDVSGEDGKADLAAHSAFMRWTTSSAGANMGMQFVMFPGTEVAVSFDRGNPDRPIIAGAVPNAANWSPTYNDNGKLASITTPKGKEVTFTETDGGDAINISVSGSPRLTLTPYATNTETFYNNHRSALTSVVTSLQNLTGSYLMNNLYADSSVNTVTVMDQVNARLKKLFDGISAFSDVETEAPQNLVMALSTLVKTCILMHETKETAKQKVGRLNIIAEPSSNSIIQFAGPTNAGEWALFVANLMQAVTEEIATTVEEFSPDVGVDADGKRRSWNAPKFINLTATITEMTTQVLLVVKLLRTLHSKIDKNSGIVIAAKDKSLTPIPLNITMAADGSITGLAKRSVVLKGTVGAAGGDSAALLLASKEKGLKKSTATLSAEGEVNILGGDNATAFMTGETIFLKSAKGSTLTLHEGEANLYGPQDVHVNGKNIAVGADDAVSLYAKTVSVSAKGNGAVIIGCEGTNKPMIAVGTDPAMVRSLPGEQKRLSEAMNKASAAKQKWLAADRDLKALEAKLETCLMEFYCAPDSSTEKIAKTTELTALQVEYGAQLGIVEALQTASQTADAEEKVQQEVVDAMSAAITSATTSIVLATGVGGAEKVEITNSEINISSNKSITLKVGGKKVVLDATGYNMYGSIKDQAGMISIG